MNVRYYKSILVLAPWCKMTLSKMFLMYLIDSQKVASGMLEPQKILKFRSAWISSVFKSIVTGKC